MKQTKKARIERTREIIDRNQVGIPFNHVDLLALQSETRYMMEAAKRMINPQFPGDPRHLHIIEEGETDWIAWSWKKAIEGSNPVIEAKRVMRFCVAADLAEFRYSIDDPFCAHCGTDQHLTVDHVDPPFDDIANEFIEQHGLPEIVDPAPGQVVNQFASIDLEAAWIQHHAERSVYQILCRSCNSSKGKNTCS